MAARLVPTDYRRRSLGLIEEHILALIARADMLKVTSTPDGASKASVSRQVHTLRARAHALLDELREKEGDLPELERRAIRMDEQCEALELAQRLDALQGLSPAPIVTSRSAMHARPSPELRNAPETPRPMHTPTSEHPKASEALRVSAWAEPDASVTSSARPPLPAIDDLGAASPEATGVPAQMMHTPASSSSVASAALPAPTWTAPGADGGPEHEGGEDEEAQLQKTAPASRGVELSAPSPRSEGPGGDTKRKLRRQGTSGLKQRSRRGSTVKRSRRIGLVVVACTVLCIILGGILVVVMLGTRHARTSSPDGAEDRPPNVEGGNKTGSFDGILETPPPPSPPLSQLGNATGRFDMDSDDDATSAEAADDDSRRRHHHHHERHRRTRRHRGDDDADSPDSDADG